MTSPLLSVSDLSISYRFRETRLPVIEDVSFEIAPGEAFGLVGESGCGKSTIALALVRYLAENGRVDAGTITVDGDDLLSLDAETLRHWRGGRIAMVYQEAGSALNPSLRIGEQIAEVFRAHGGIGSAEAMRRAREVVDRVALPDPELMLRRYPHQLSGGQQQRVVIAMALAGNPRLLILDEPTTGLDATVEAEVIDLIAALRRELDVAILFISHNLGLVSRVCDRVGILYSGRIVEEGRASEVLQAPRHPYTHGLVRCVPPFGASKRTLRLEPIPGALPALGDELPGCRFAPRCPLARDVCRREEPSLLDVGSERRSRCHFWTEVAQLPRASAPTEPVAADVTAPGPSAGDLLELRSLRRSYGNVRPVDDVSLAIGRGEIFGLVGESGSGKTTLVNCIAGLVPPDDGDLLYDGEPLERRVEARSGLARRRLQMVFQNPDSTLNPRHTIGYVLERAAHLLGGARDARTLAAEVRIPERVLEVRSAQLSGGQKQRVAIARAFAGSPELVLCDEPVSALDVSVQAAVLNLLADLQAAEGVSYVFISHDLGVVRYLADRIGVMYLGQIVEIGAAADVFEPPQHPYTEALVSAIPTLELRPGRERIRLQGPPPSLASPPSGCRFYTRCPRKIGAICETEAPPWRDAGDAHAIRCHYPIDDLRTLQSGPTADEHGRRGEPRPTTTEA